MTIIAAGQGAGSDSPSDNKCRIYVKFDEIFTAHIVICQELLMFNRKLFITLCVSLILAAGLNTACTKSETESQSNSKPKAQLTVSPGAEVGTVLVRSTRFR